MAGDKGVENSSKGGSQPLGSAVAGSSRPVFISYASQDAPVAQKVCSALEAAVSPAGSRLGTWYRDALYAEGIVRALDESKVLVLILSERPWLPRMWARNSSELRLNAIRSSRLKSIAQH